jgi:hypothetical protein
LQNRLKLFSMNINYDEVLTVTPGMNQAVRVPDTGDLNADSCERHAQRLPFS